MSSGIFDGTAEIIPIPAAEFTLIERGVLCQRNGNEYFFITLILIFYEWGAVSSRESLNSTESKLL
jgi:hypothetical protein